MTPLPRRISARFFWEGADAFRDDVDKDRCPYSWGSPEASYWTTGWEAAEWEDSENFRISDDEYNDPRHGQAEGLNRGIT